MTIALDDSYAACRDLARRAARNFYYSFWMLPAEKRAAMCALYAFFRRTDDLGDDGPVEQRREKLRRWREAWHRAQRDAYVDPLLPAVVDTVRRYQIPSEYLETAVDGVESDLEQRRFETFDELAAYCYQVASVVGLASIHVWGFRQTDEARRAAEACGVAFQLTNILRDVGEDAAVGRVYLPQRELRQFGVSEEGLVAGRVDEPWRNLMRYQLERADGFYAAARGLVPYLEPDGVGIYGAMYDIYRALFDKIRDRRGDVFRNRVRLTAWHKTTIVARRMVPRLFGRSSVVAASEPAP